MEKEEILAVLGENIKVMNNTSNKSIADRMREMRTVINQLAVLVLDSENQNNAKK